MFITVINIDNEFYYRCYEKCDDCPMKFMCYTTTWHKYRNENQKRVNYGGSVDVHTLIILAIEKGIVREVGAYYGA